MKVLMTADTLGGVWTFALELARALAPRGVRTALATLGAPLSPRQWDEAKGVPGLDVHEGRWKLEWMDNPWADVEASGRWLLDVERRVRPDVVHLNGTMSHAALPWRAPVVVTGHSCVLSWWHGARGQGAPPEFDRYRDEVARGLRAAGLVTAPTVAMLGALAAHYGGPLPRTRVVPNGRDPRRFPFADRKEPLVLSAGRLWDEAKNIGALAAAAPGLRAGWTACVAGDDRHPDNGGVASHPNLRLLGRLDAEDLACWMRRAAIYALPARYEPFGLSALEAAFAGCALVLGDIPSLRETWQGAAVFVPPDNPDALGKALKTLTGRPELCRAYARRARVRARDFTPERMAEGYLAAYREVRGAAAAA